MLHKKGTYIQRTPPPVPLAITPTFRPCTHTSDDSYMYQLSLVVATATVSFHIACLHGFHAKRTSTIRGVPNDVVLVVLTTTMMLCEGVTCNNVRYTGGQDPPPCTLWASKKSLWRH